MSDTLFKKNRRLLVIDDHQSIHADFRKILQPEDESSIKLDAAGAELFGEGPRHARTMGFEMDSALSGEDGLARVREALAADRPYALAFVDVRMAPGWDGIETTARICASDANIQIVICTAYSDYSWEEMMGRLGQSDRLVILKKPFDTIEVLQLAHALVEKWALAQQARLRLDQLAAMVASRTQELQAANEHLKFEMAERARTEEVLRQSQKMEAVGQLAGGIAHDFNNLLTVIRGWVYCLTMEMDRNAPLSEALRQIDTATERAAKLTAQMLMFSRKAPVHPQVLDLNEIVAQFGNLLNRLLGETITLEIETGMRPLTIRADPVLIEMVILNLAVNARDAMPDGGRLLLQAAEIEITDEDSLRRAQSRPGRFACVSVTDTGCGIPAEIVPHLFEPFFTTKEVGKGTGLGLASAYGVVKLHKGWIEVESAPGRGATFKVFLPLEATEPKPAAPPETAPVLVGGKETILLVEDEPPVRNLAKRLLEYHGYHVHEAANGTEALALWAAHRTEIDLLLTDMIMPGGCSGKELAEKVLADRCDLKVIYTTGYSPDTFGDQLVLREGVNFLGKPYAPENLIQTIRRCLDAGGKG